MIETDQNNPYFQSCLSWQAAGYRRRQYTGEEKETAAQTGKGQRMSHEELWEILEAHQGEPFYTVKGRPVRYTGKWEELLEDRRDKSITRS
ncbi:MAG: hypothetical protein LUD18_05905, partial [Lachnospiraceae bacterium]|nr:hypothetical protein [Lachnospiraceae bacterium]